MSDSFATPRTVAHQAPLSMGFPRQGYWSGLPFPSPGDLSDPGLEPRSPVSPVLAGGFFLTSATWEAQIVAEYLPNAKKHARHLTLLAIFLFQKESLQ